ncbi:MAG TPA: hypothetical protein VGK82_17490 [Pyrinomonadaceae bacterium]
MQNYFAKILLLLAGFALAAFSFPARDQLRPVPPGVSMHDEVRKILPKHSVFPPVARWNEPSIPQDPQDQERRVHRERLKGLNKYKPILDPGVREINGQVESVDLTFIDEVTVLKPGEREDPIGLPLRGAIVVVGTVTSGNAYVNQEHTLVFSEYKVAVQEVLKADPDSVISAGDELTTWRSGGSVRFPAGHVAHFIIVGRGFPEVGTPYVLFLRRPDKTVKDYAISTAYSIKDQVLQLDDINYKRSYDGMPVKDFLDKLRQEISARREGGDD